MNDSKAKVFFLVILLLFSLLFWWKFVFSPYILIHGDFRFAFTVNEHIFHHLKNAYQLPKVPFLLPLYCLSKICGDLLAEKLFTVLILYLSLLWVYFAHKYFLSKILFNAQNLLLSFYSFYGAIIFLFNPWTINKAHHHYWLVLGLAASYLMIAKLDEELHSTFSFRRLIFMGILFCAIASSIQPLIIYFTFLFLIYLGLKSICYGKKFLIKIFTKKNILVFILIVLLNAFWVAPFSIIILLGSESPSYPIIPQNVHFLSRRGSILNVFQLTNSYPWAEKNSSILTNYSLNFMKSLELWEVIPLFLIAFIFLFVLFYDEKYKKKFYFLFFNLIFLSSILISCGTKAPFFGKIYELAFLNLPLGWVIRDPYKNTGLVVIALSILYLHGMHLLCQKIKLASNISISIVLICFMVLPFFWGWPILTGDLNGHLKFIKYPNDLSNIISYLHRSLDNNGEKILWLTKEKSKYYYHNLPELSSASLNVVHLSNDVRKYISFLIDTNNISNFETIINILGVNYIILRKDFDSSHKKLNSSSWDDGRKAERLLSKIFVPIYKSHDFIIFKNQAYVQVFDVNGFNLLSFNLSHFLIDLIHKASETQVKIMNCKKIDSKYWELQIKSKKSFLLSFTEPYDNFWQAQIYKDGKVIDQVNAIPVLGIINGFYIKPNGNLTVQIKYMPEIWRTYFKAGLFITTLSFFIVCCMYKKYKSF
ncbi:hypothetical protein KFV02_11080 [Desulfohalobiaceae bacterium Ax17]|uniref:hypothetical protein n=1 Tax=Desulfovulcanus ferrireducens TaxID=2831190 RepID=UPI00207B9B5C|nr:hypothetical protein [Desulfovulcanus ferrireducens]MBT8764477.1 hypothetical protein [Desulfovulcanus ferrireducens]